MKLIGSRTENLIRDQLERAEQDILNDEAIHNLLINNFKKVKHVYCLSQTIEQAEDIYTLLVNGAYVIEFELSRLDNSISDAHIESLNEYSKKVKGKTSKLTLAIAMDLSNK